MSEHYEESKPKDIPGYAYAIAVIICILFSFLIFKYTFYLFKRCDEGHMLSCFLLFNRR